MCDVAERLERKGIEIGHLEAIQRMIKKDYSKEAILDLGYKFVAKTHRLAYGMKATFL